MAASSWKEECVLKLMRSSGLGTTIADQCMHGLRTKGPTGGASGPTGRVRKLMAAKKTTRFLSNAEYLLKELSKRCDGGHEHQPLLDGRAKAAAIYPEGLCRAMCKGLMRQLQIKRGKVKPLLEVSAETTMGEKPENIRRR